MVRSFSQRLLHKLVLAIPIHFGSSKGHFIIGDQVEIIINMVGTKQPLLVMPGINIRNLLTWVVAQFSVILKEQ